MSGLLWVLTAATLLATVSAGPLDHLLHPKQSRTIQWIGGSFEWPCTTTKNIFKQSNRYIPKNIIGTRFQIYGNCAFVALPRFKEGVPATLVKVNLGHKGCQAILEPFPCWAVQEEGNCEALQSVVDLFLDPNDILWVLDVGIVNTLEQPVRRCAPKIVAIDVKCGKILRTIDLTSLTCSNSRLQYLAIDYAPDGRVFAYVSDAANRAILVYDILNCRGYRLVLPKAVTEGCSRQDVLYIALVRPPCGSATLFFTYLSSDHLFSIKTEFLYAGSAAGKVHDVGVKPAKFVLLGTDGGSSIFFRYEGQGEIYRWDACTCFSPENFHLVHRSSNCLLATQVVPDLKCQRMRVLESNFPDFVNGCVGCGAYQTISNLDGNCC